MTNTSSITDKLEWENICNEIITNNSIYTNFKTYYGDTFPICGVSLNDANFYNKHFNNLSIEIQQKIINNKEKLLENDNIGSPIKINSILGDIGTDTLRYVYTLGELINIFNDLTNFNILEIGGGYGGQCKIINNFFKINTYTIIDISCALNLQQKYLEKFNNIYYINGKEDLPETSFKYDLVISNYAFSELSLEYQEKYIKYIHSIKSGYIIDNNSSHQRNGKFKKKGLISKPFNEFINNFENINNYKTNTNPQYNNITYYWK